MRPTHPRGHLGLGFCCPRPTLAVSTRCRCADDEKPYGLAGQVGHLMWSARRDLNPGAGRKDDLLLGHTHRRLSLQDVEELVGSVMHMPLFGGVGRHGLFDHRESGRVDKPPTVAAVSPSVVRRVSSADRAAWVGVRCQGVLRCRDRNLVSSSDLVRWKRSTLPLVYRSGDCLSRLGATGPPSRSNSRRLQPPGAFQGQEGAHCRVAAPFQRRGW